jgi:hypothetical protein
VIDAAVAHRYRRILNVLIFDLVFRQLDRASTRLSAGSTSTHSGHMGEIELARRLAGLGGLTS